MSKKKQAKKQAKAKRPAWGLVNFEVIEKARKDASMPRYAMAEALGVTNGTYHNWQSGRSVPSPGTQRRIKATLLSLDSKPEQPTAPEPSFGSWVSQDAVATIVAAYLANGGVYGRPDTEELCELIRGVGRALGGA